MKCLFCYRGQYKHTEFNVLDDKYHKAQYLFESTGELIV